MTEQPTWFVQLQHDLNAPIMVPDGAAIDWDRCRDLFLIALLQRLESRWGITRPDIVRGLLQRRLAGEEVIAELSADADAERTDQLADLRATAAAAAAADAERTDQLADLQAAVAASTQQPALPDGYIVPTPVDLAALHDPTFSDGLTPSQHRDVLAGGAGTRGSAPNDDELLRTYGVAKRDHCYEGPIDDWPKRAERAATVHGLRAVLARWGATPPASPVPQGLTDEELREMWLSQEWFNEGATFREFASIVSRWGRPAIEPVPVSDPPGPKDCDAEGLCWWWSRDITAWCLCFAADGDSSEWTHWLPHWAIPQPQTGDVQP
jgi:hypothetical protein